MDKETMRRISEANIISEMGKWHSWDSPIGLSIFFVASSLSITLLATTALLIRNIIK